MKKLMFTSRSNKAENASGTEGCTVDPQRVNNESVNLKA